MWGLKFCTGTVSPLLLPVLVCLTKNRNWVIICELSECQALYCLQIGGAGPVVRLFWVAAGNVGDVDTRTRTS